MGVNIDYPAGLVEDAAINGSATHLTGRGIVGAGLVGAGACRDRPITEANELARCSQVCRAANATH